VAWKTAIPGKGWSSPVTSGDRIFLTTAIPLGGTQELHLLELDANSGEIEWDATVFSSLITQFAAIHGKNSYATPTPLIDGDRIYVHFGPHGTACLAMDGTTVWKTRELAYDPNLGGGSSPVLVDGILVINCDGSDQQFVAGVDAKTGKILWRTERQPSNETQHYAFSTPLVIEVNGKKQVVSSGAADANALDPQTGADIWRVHYGGFSTVSRPLFGNGLVYLAAGYSLLMAIRPDGRGDVTNSHIAWKQTRSMPKVPSLLLDTDNLYAIEDSGIAACLDARTGKVRWTHRIGGTYSASPLLAMGKIYALDEDGITIVFAASPKEYVQIAKNRLNEQCLASPGVIDNALLIRTASSLYRIENTDAASRPPSRGT
jgi:outer membrane protein assembly factor BamB